MEVSFSMWSFQMCNGLLYGSFSFFAENLMLSEGSPTKLVICNSWSYLRPIYWATSDKLMLIAAMRQAAANWDGLYLRKCDIYSVYLQYYLAKFVICSVFWFYS